MARPGYWPQRPASSFRGRPRGSASDLLLACLFGVLFFYHQLLPDFLLEAALAVAFVMAFCLNKSLRPPVGSTFVTSIILMMWMIAMALAVGDSASYAGALRYSYLPLALLPLGCWLLPDREQVALVAIMLVTLPLAIAAASIPIFGEQILFPEGTYRGILLVRAGGVSGNPNYFAMKMLVALSAFALFTWPRRSRVLVWSSFALTMIAVGMTGSRMGILGALLIGYVAVQRQITARLALVCVQLAFLAGLLLMGVLQIVQLIDYSAYFDKHLVAFVAERSSDVVEGSASSRYDIWNRISAFLLQDTTRALVGIGPDKFMDVIPGNDKFPHNSFIRIWGDGGAIAAAVAVFIWGRIGLWYLSRRVIWLVWIGWSVAMVANDTWMTKEGAVGISLLVVWYSGLLVNRSRERGLELRTT